MQLTKFFSCICLRTLRKIEIFSLKWAKKKIWIEFKCVRKSLNVNEVGTKKLEKFCVFGRHEDIIYNSANLH